MSETDAQAAGGSYAPRPAISAGGSIVVFESPLGSLVPGDTNNAIDLFMTNGSSVTRVFGNGAVQLDCAAQRPAVSSSGRFVAFDSCATNAVAGDTNAVNDVFVLDRNTGAVTRVSVATGGAQADAPSYSAAISPDGRFVAFLSSATTLVAGATNIQVYLHDRDNGTTVAVSRANGGGAFGTADASGRPSVSNTGWVAFTSDASNLVANDVNGVADVFVGNGTATDLVSRPSVGGQLASASGSPSISADHRFVAFTTAAPATPSDANPVNDVFVRDRTANVTVLVSRTPGGQAGNGSSFEPVISASGAYIVFTSLATDIDGSFDAVLDVFRAALNIGGGAVTVANVSRFSVGTQTATGASTQASVSDGGLVVFASNEPTLAAGDTNGDTDVFVASAPGLTQRLTVTASGLTETYSGTSSRPQPSFMGDTVAFLSSATNLVPGDVNGTVDVFVRNVVTGTTTRLPVPTGYESVDANWVSISHDGRWVAYNRLISFLHDRSTGTTVPVSVAAAGGVVAQAAQPKVSASGRYVAFVTAASLTAGDTNQRADVYVFDRIMGISTLASRTVANGIGNGSSTSPGISGDGRYVVFAFSPAKLAPGDPETPSNIFVRDMVAGTTRWVSDVPPQAGYDSRDPSISTDGRYVSFLFLTATVSIEGTAPSRVYIARTDGTAPLRGSMSGATANEVVVDDTAYDPTLSLFGRFLSFRSYKANLFGGDSNAAADVFARQVLDGAGAETFGTAVLATPSTSGTAATGGSPFATENPELSGNGTAVAFQSAFTTLVNGDTNGMVDAFQRRPLFAAGECTFVDTHLPGYTLWLANYDIDPCSDNGSPYADPDGDGLTNEEERTAGSNPILGAFTRYFAEGATKTEGLDFDVRIALANPSGDPVSGEISYQLPSGVPVAPTAFTLLPYERKTVLLDQQDGVGEGGPAPAYEFATTVKATAPIGVDRTMTWSKQVYAGHAEVGVVSPARTWYFAEGATIAGFNLFYLLQNPSPETVTVEGRYLLGTGQTFSKSYQLPPNSRTNVWANVELIGNATPLASAEFSAVFNVTSGPAIIAERAMYKGMTPLFKAGHESAGITEPATEWFLAEGNAGQFFDMFVLIGNTTGNDALIEAQFTVGNPATIYTKQYMVNRNSRFNIWVDQQELSPGVFPFQGTGNTDVSIRIRSLNNVPLIVERAMWWPGDSNSWYEAHNSPATARPAPRWVLGEGESGGALAWQTYVLVANTGEAAGQIQIRLLPAGGGDIQPLIKSVAARSRQTYPLAELLAEAGLPVDAVAGVLVESVGGPLPLVVERAMYRNANGQTFIVGTNALGTPLP